MIFKTQFNHVTHYVAKRNGEVFCDAYNFFSMTRMENAYFNLIRMNATLIGAVEETFDNTQRFSLHLDLLNNQGNEYIINKVNHLIHAVTNRGLQFADGNAQQNFMLHNLTVTNICDLINDPTFQSANVLDTYSTWRITSMN